MAETNSKAQREEVKLEGAMTVDETPSRTKLTFDLATSMRALQNNLR